MTAHAKTSPVTPDLGRVAAVVVTFFPEPGVADTLSAIAQEAGEVIVIDNGSDAASLAVLSAWADPFPNTRRVIANPSNRGLAAAQNQGIAAALDEGADWVWLFDDDSRPVAGTLDAFTRVEADSPGRFDLLAPRVRHRDGGGLAPLTERRGRWRAVRRVPGRDARITDPVFVIASGSLIRAGALRALGGLRESFFIDYVDVDFCLRLFHAGRHSVVVGEAMLDHRLGAPTRHGLPGGFTLTTSNHSAHRRRFMTRNRMRLWREYVGREPGWVFLDAVAFGYQLVRIVLFEQNRRAKLAAIGRGVRDGLFVPPDHWGGPDRDREMER